MAKKAILSNSEILFGKKPSNSETISFNEINEALKETLENRGILVEKEIYRSNVDLKTAQGIVFLNIPGQMDKIFHPFISWVHSYDDLFPTRFATGIHLDEKCVIGEGMFKKIKRSSKTLHEVVAEAVDSIPQEFTKLSGEIDAMHNLLPLKEDMISKIIGELFLFKDCLTTEQVSEIKGLLKKEFSDTDDFNLWEVYVKVICKSLVNSHPGKWMKQQSAIHKYMLRIQKELPALESPKVSEDNVLEGIKEEGSNQETMITTGMEEPELISFPEISLDPQHHELDDSAIFEAVEEEEEFDRPAVTDYMNTPKEVEPPQELPTEVGTQVSKSGSDFDIEEALWDCLSCGKPQYANDIFYDGQLCASCVKG